MNYTDKFLTVCKQRLSNYLLAKKLIDESGGFSFVKLVFYSSVNSSLEILGIGIGVSLLFGNNSANFLGDLPKVYGLLVLFLLIIAKGIVNVFTSVESNEIQASLEEELSFKFFSLALNASSEQVQNIGRGKIIALIEDDIGTVVASLKYLINGFQALFSFLIFTFGILIVADRNAIPLILAIATTIIAAFLQGSNSYKLGEKETKVNASIQQTIGDGLYSLKAVRAAQAEDWILKRFIDDMIIYRKISRQTIKRSSAYNAWRESLVMGILSVWIILSRQDLGASTITTTLLLAYKTSTSFSGIINAQRLYLRFIPAYKELRIQRQKLIREESYSANNNSPIYKNKHLRGDFVQSILWTSDQFNSDKKLTLKLSKGKLVAIVGPSGSGKTTKLDLFCGLREEAKSHWNVQTDYNNYDFLGLSGARQIRNLISYAPQNAVLFEASLRHNLLISRVEKTDKLYAWLRRLRLSHLLEREAGLDTPLKLSQSPFSGGEIQRLGLLRAWIRNQPIEVLDEPTAFLDKLNAEVVRSIIFERVKHKLVLVSTHDPLLISQASAIITLQTNNPD